MAIPLEDNHEDIVGKAMRGLGYNPASLAREAGIAPEAVERVLGGENDEDALRALAPVLRLHTGALLESARQSWFPDAPDVAGVARFDTPFGDMRVNAYLVRDAGSREAAVFDTGTDASPILQAIERDGLDVRRIFLTHSHRDHVADLGKLRSATGAPVSCGEDEPVQGADAFAVGADFSLGGLTLETRLTRGHSRGGVTYVIHGLERAVAIVGDALFAGSMGGGSVSYRDALDTTARQILELPDDALLCPGHGPMTTVGEEKRHNPFFAR